MLHRQIHNRSLNFGHISNEFREISVSPMETRKESVVLSVDQFFSQQHRLKNGFIDTSPLNCADASASAHIFPTGAQKSFPADAKLDDIFSMIVSKKIQTPAELSRLVMLRPKESDYEDFAPDSTPDSIPDSSSES